MTDENTSRTTSRTSGRNNSGRLILLTIVGLPVTMVLTATWLWYYVVNGKLDIVGALGTANRGHLVQPPRKLDSAVLHEKGAVVRYADMPPKWTLLVANTGDSCADSCEQLLYLTRQIHRAMGKYFDRIDRFYIGDTPPGQTALAVTALSDGAPLPASFPAYLQGQHQDLQALTVGPVDFQGLFPELAADDSTWYVVDPAGWVMMSYNSAISYKDVIADLKFLLKNSSE